MPVKSPRPVIVFAMTLLPKAKWIEELPRGWKGGSERVAKNRRKSHRRVAWIDLAEARWEGAETEMAGGCRIVRERKRKEGKVGNRGGGARYRTVSSGLCKFGRSGRKEHELEIAGGKARVACVRVCVCVWLCIRDGGVLCVGPHFAYVEAWTWGAGGKLTSTPQTETDEGNRQAAWAVQAE